MGWMPPSLTPMGFTLGPYPPTPPVERPPGGPNIFPPDIDPDDVPGDPSRPPIDEPPAPIPVPPSERPPVPDRL
jgi:hypothetical protein